MFDGVHVQRPWHLQSKFTAMSFYTECFPTVRMTLSIGLSYVSFKFYFFWYSGHELHLKVSKNALESWNKILKYSFGGFIHVIAQWKVLTEEHSFRVSHWGSSTRLVHWDTFYSTLPLLGHCINLLVVFVYYYQDNKVDLQGDLKGVFIMNKHFWNSFVFSHASFQSQTERSRTLPVTQYPLLGKVTWCIIFDENNSKRVFLYYRRISSVRFCLRNRPKRTFLLVFPRQYSCQQGKIKVEF